MFFVGILNTHSNLSYFYRSLVSLGEGERYSLGLEVRLNIVSRCVEQPWKILPEIKNAESIRRERPGKGAVGSSDMGSWVPEWARYFPCLVIPVLRMRTLNLRINYKS